MPVLAAQPLRVGSSGDYTPFSFHDSGGVLVGFDIDVATRLAADLGRPLQLESFRWPDLVERLHHGEFDLAMSGVTQRGDRAVRLAFSRPYAVTGAVAVIRNEKRKRFATVQALNHAGVRLAVNAGGHLERVARAQFARAEIVSIADNTTLPVRLSAGEIDAVISEELEARGWDRKQFRILGPFTRDRKAYALPRAAVELQAQIDDWLAAREVDGWLDALRRKWLGAATAMSAQQSCFEALTAAVDLRLQLMPMVAAVKRREGLPIQDPSQEAAVLEKARSNAAAAGLPADAVVELFGALIEAARAVQQHETDAAPPELNLADLRTAIAGQSAQVIAELVRCAPLWQPASGSGQLRVTLQRGITVAGTKPELIDRIAKATQHVLSTRPPDASPWR